MRSVLGPRPVAEAAGGRIGGEPRADRVRRAGAETGESGPWPAARRRRSRRRLRSRVCLFRSPTAPSIPRPCSTLSGGLKHEWSGALPRVARLAGQEVGLVGDGLRAHSSGDVLARAVDASSVESGRVCASGGRGAESTSRPGHERQKRGFRVHERTITPVVGPTPVAASPPRDRAATPTRPSAQAGPLPATAATLPVVIGSSVLIYYYLRFTVMVERRLQGERWLIPARLYARPIALRTGMVLSQPDLVKILNGLKTRKKRHPRRRGPVRGRQRPPSPSRPPHAAGEDTGADPVTFRRGSKGDGDPRPPRPRRPTRR